jgi:SHS2 domain-containing protein
MGRYRVLDDVALADCALDVEGRDLDDLFETAAVALAELMVDPTTVEISTERTVTLAASALDLLLYDWLSELIYRKDRDQEVFPQVRVRVTERPSAHLEAHLRGGLIDRNRTSLRADPKAVTFHQFQVTAVDGGWRARLVIDI